MACPVGKWFQREESLASLHLAEGMGREHRQWSLNDRFGPMLLKSYFGALPAQA
jgi:hypothetical protein